jgi:glycosyltransferase involved in cell wall biosynthesis
VLFHGYKQKNDLPYFFAKADLFLFPTKFDIWGLVLNEAMSAGLPCLASLHAGAVHDLITENVTGFKVDFDLTEKVTRQIDFLLSNHDEARRVGTNAENFILEHASINKSTEGFLKAIYEI